MTLAADILTDLDTMLDSDEFAIAATLDAATINVIFDAGYSEDLEVAGASPTATGKTADFTAASRGDTITIPVGGTDYTIRNLRPDGTGETILDLEEQ